MRNRRHTLQGLGAVAGLVAAARACENGQALHFAPAAA